MASRVSTQSLPMRVRSTWLLKELRLMASRQELQSCLKASTCQVPLTMSQMLACKACGSSFWIEWTLTSSVGCAKMKRTSWWKDCRESCGLRGFSPSSHLMRVLKSDRPAYTLVNSRVRPFSSSCKLVWTSAPRLTCRLIAMELVVAGLALVQSIFSRARSAMAEAFLTN